MTIPNKTERQRAALLESGLYWGYIKGAVELAFDPVKSAQNNELRGLPFERAAEFDFTTAIIRQDTREAYPEARYQALGRLGEMICLLVFTPIAGGIRVISLRLASRKERRRWHASQSQN